MSEDPRVHLHFQWLQSFYYCIEMSCLASEFRRLFLDTVVSPTFFSCPCLKQMVTSLVVVMLISFAIFCFFFFFFYTFVALHILSVWLFLFMFVICGRVYCCARVFHVLRYLPYLLMLSVISLSLCFFPKTNIFRIFSELHFKALKWRWAVMNGVNKKRRACVTVPSVEPACSLWFIDVKKK